MAMEKITKEYKVNNCSYDNLGVTISYEKPLKHHEMPKGYYLSIRCFNRTKAKDKYNGMAIITDEFALYDYQHIGYRLISASNRFNRKTLEKIADKTIYNIDDVNNFILRNGKKYNVTDDPILVKDDQF